MINKIYNFIIENNMIQDGDRLVLGVSGGADSICLLYVLKELQARFNMEIIVVHVNHGIRSNEADEDEEFVKNICKNLGVPCESYKYNAIKVAEEMKISEEEAGRYIRYKSFEETCNKYNANKIAVAHNKNDVSETFLFNLFRGSGLKGLISIPVKRDNIIRPILCCSRKDIENYINKNNIQYRTDATNYEDIYTRNKIRLNIIPYAENEINEQTVEHIYQASAIIRETDDYIELMTNSIYDKCVTKINNGYSININQLSSEHIVIQKNIIRKIIYNTSNSLRNIESLHIEQIISLLNKEVGKSIQLPYNIIAKKTYDSIEISIKSDKLKLDVSYQYSLSAPGKYYIDSIGKSVSLDVFDYNKDDIIPKSMYTKWFDYDTIKDTLKIRTRQQGDYIILKGVNGRKKLKDYFIDNKIPKEERDSIPLLASGKHIIWIIGQRINETNKVTEKTKKILSVEIITEEDIIWKLK